MQAAGVLTAEHYQLNLLVLAVSDSLPKEEGLLQQLSVSAHRAAPRFCWSSPQQQVQAAAARMPGTPAGVRSKHRTQRGLDATETNRQSVLYMHTYMID